MSEEQEQLAETQQTEDTTDEGQVTQTEDETAPVEEETQVDDVIPEEENPEVIPEEQGDSEIDADVKEPQLDDAAEETEDTKAPEDEVQQSKEPSEESDEAPEDEVTPEDEEAAVEEEPDVEDETSSESLSSEIEESKIEREPHPLDELTDQQVIDIVNEIEMENRHLILENTLFENFLRENDPSLLEGMDEVLEYLNERLAFQPPESQDRISVPDKPRPRIDSYSSITSIAEGKGPKINISQKTEMIMRAMEESQTWLEQFLKKAHVTERNLKSELEEFGIREAEIKEAIDSFEYTVVTQGLDKLTQRIPAEKFIRYMEEWLKSSQLHIEKLRLRIATLKVQYKKVSQQLIQRQELGENVHAVDFDQLEIENKHFIEKIDQKNIHMIELKKMNGGANLVLSIHKKYLHKQQEECNKLKSEIDLKNKMIEDTEEELQTAEDEVKEAYEKFMSCKKLKQKYSVPEVMEYVRLKGQLYDLKKNVKMWTRRRSIQDIALNTCLRQMKSLTGRANIDPKWLDAQYLDSELSSEDLSVDL